MAFAPPASLMLLLGNVFEGHWQQAPSSVPLPTLHAGGGIEPPPLWVVHGVSAFDMACVTVWGRAELAMVLLVLGGKAPNMDQSPVPEVVRVVNVPHDPHVAVTSLREREAVE